MAGDNVYAALRNLGFEEVRFGKMGPAIHYIGTWGGYAISFTARNGGFWADYAVRLDKNDRQTAKTLTETLKAQGLQGIKCNNMGDHLQFFLKFNNKTPKVDQFRSYFNSITNLLAQMGIRPAQTCSICGGGNPESLFFNGNTYQPAHRACVEQGLYETTRKAEDNSENGSYGLGIVGAVAGAIVGMIPSIILAIIGYVAALLCALVPVCSAWGYRKLGGKKNAVSIVIIVILSLISALLVNIAATAYYINSEYQMGLGQSLGIVFNYYFAGGNFFELIQDSAQMLLFMVLGVIISIRFIGVTNKTEVKAGVKLAETLRVNPAFKATSAGQAAQAGQGSIPQTSWSAGTVAKPTWDADNVPQSTWGSGTVAKPDWDAGVNAQQTWNGGNSFDAGNKGKKPNGFDL